MCALPDAIGNWNCWLKDMVDSNPHDGENILFSGEGPCQSVKINNSSDTK